MNLFTQPDVKNTPKTTTVITATNSVDEPLTVFRRGVSADSAHVLLVVDMIKHFLELAGINMIVAVALAIEPVEDFTVHI